MSPLVARQMPENQAGTPPTGESFLVRRPDVRLGCASGPQDGLAYGVRNSESCAV